MSFRKLFCFILACSSIPCGINAMKNDVKKDECAKINLESKEQKFKYFPKFAKRLYETKGVSEPLRVVFGFVSEFISVHLGKNHADGPLIKNLKDHMNQLENCDDMCPSDVVYTPDFELCCTMEYKDDEIVVGVESLEDDNLIYTVLSDVEKILETMYSLISNKDFMSEFFPDGLDLVSAFDDFVTRHVVSTSELEK